LSTYSNTPQQGALAAYPNHTIDPRKKDYNWCLQYTRAAYKDARGFMPFAMQNTGALKMAEIAMYAMGKQPTDKYKKIMSPGNPTDESWRAIDWTPPAFMCKFREIAISKLLQKDFDIQCFAVDELARSEEDNYFNQMKVKIMMREAAQQQGSDLADSPLLQAQPNEAEDLEQLEMEKEFGYKHVMAMEAEEAIQLIQQQNGIGEKRKQTVTNLVDFGIGGYTTYIDENGMTKFRAVNPEYLGLSYCEKPDFSDLVHWFEIVPTYVGDLAPYYTKEQLDDICKKSLGKNGNPMTYVPVSGFYNQAWNRWKIFVVQIKFLSWNETVYKEEKDNTGNERFRKSSYNNKQFLVNKDGKLEESDDDEQYGSVDEEYRGEATPKYLSSTKKVVYKASWIVDTDYMHDWGLQENQNRKLSSWWDTDLDIYLYSWNFYKMQFTGITERLIPLEDKACMTWFNLQNLSNKLIPYLIKLDFTAIESVNFGKGGKKTSPAETIDFIFSNFVVPYRSNDLISRSNPNYTPMSIEATGQLAAFAQLYEELQNTIEMMRQVSGLNEVTDGSTVDQKTLNGATSAMQASTNNALYLISEADKNLIRRLSDGIVQKVQIAVKLGKVEGYAKALGSQSIKFMQINPDIALHELGIFIEDAPTKEERAELLQELNMKESQGLIYFGDKIMVMSCRNLKQAAMVLDYKINKRKQEANAQQQQLVQMQGQQNQQVALAAEQAKQQTAQIQGQIDAQIEHIRGQWNYMTEMAKKNSDLNEASVHAHAKVIGDHILANAKIAAQQIASHHNHVDTALTVAGHLEGKKIDAKNKPKPTAKK
jgi:hypothetical protein